MHCCASSLSFPREISFCPLAIFPLLPCPTTSSTVVQRVRAKDKPKCFSGTSCADRIDLLFGSACDSAQWLYYDTYGKEKRKQSYRSSNNRFDKSYPHWIRPELWAIINSYESVEIVIAPASKATKSLIT
jgi:hypothetical protein